MDSIANPALARSCGGGYFFYFFFLSLFFSSFLARRSHCTGGWGVVGVVLMGGGSVHFASSARADNRRADLVAGFLACRSPWMAWIVGMVAGLGSGAFGAMQYGLYTYGKTREFTKCVRPAVSDV